MFGKLLYYDRERIEDFKAVIRGKNSAVIKESQNSSEKVGGLDLKFVGAGVSSNTTYTAEIRNSLLLESVEFEKMLVDRDDYFDFFTDEYDLDSIGRGNLIKIWGEISVPEEFDYAHAIKKLKPFLMLSMQEDDDFDEDSAVAMNALISGDDEIRIPVILEYGEAQFCSMLNSNCLMCTFEELENLEDEEVTILARMENLGRIKKSKPIYDPLKDFITLNRVLRRSMGKDRGEGLEPLYLDDDYYKFEIVAIYQ